MTIAPHDLDLTARIAAAILNSLLAGMGIALVAWVVTRLSRVQGSGTRFVVWFIALVSVAVLPWLGVSEINQSHQVSSVVQSAVTLPASLAVYLAVLWILGSALGLVRVGISLHRVSRLRSTCTAVDLNQLDPSLQNRLAEIQASRRVTLCTSDSVRVPAAIGYVRPIVVFPAWALQEIAPAELNAILAHELAHLRRWDDWTNLAQKIVKAVLFFHPAVWFIENRLSIEREMACDDAVLAANFNPRAYAESLVGLAEKSFLRRGVELAQAAVGHVHQLKMRIAQILSKDRRGSGGMWKPAVALMAIAAVVAAYGVSHAPSLVVFNSAAPQATSSVVAARAVSTPETLLQPVNVSFRSPAPKANAIPRAGASTRPRIVHSVAFKPPAAVAQRTTQSLLGEEEVIAPPMIVLSNFPARESGVAPSAVLVVMQGQQFGVDGPIFWRLTVIRFTLAQQRMITGGVPRKI